jgi:hypothetical protein
MAVVINVAKVYDHIWRWEGSWWRPVYRKGERCRVVIRSLRMNSILVEFEDGFRTVTSAWAVKPAPLDEQLKFF